MTRSAARWRRRAAHVAVLSVGTLLGGIVLARLLPTGRPFRSSLSIVLAYSSLAALLATLAVGPLRLLRGRPNPRSTDLRRDLGLWSAGAGLTHVVLSLGNHMGGDVGRYFFAGGEAAVGQIRRDAFGLGVWTAVPATAVLVLLAAISNDRSVRWMGRRWKQLQRANYVLVPLVLAHTALFLVAQRRTPVLWAATATGALLTAGLQQRGFARTRRQRDPA